jgi:hypothetical protein
MKFSMNGFRAQLSRDTESMKDIVQDIINDNFYEKEDLVEAMNEIITHSNIINCVYYSDDPDFTDMSGTEIEHLELSDGRAS